MTSALFFRLFAGCLAAAVLNFLLVDSARAQAPAQGANFPGVQKALSPDQYEAAGVGKLSPEERAKLDNYLRSYFAGETRRVVQQTTTKVTAEVSASAVDQAVKEKRVQPPELIQSRIIGKVSGWKRDKVFVLENGQHWRISENGDRHFTELTDPEVILVRDFLSYRMAIAGGGVARVTRTQ